MNNTKIKFIMTLTDAPEQTLSKIQDLTKCILRAAGEKEEDTDRVTYNNIVKGSTVVEGNINPSNSVSVASVSLNSALGSGTIGQFTVQSHTITSDSDEMEEKGKGLVIGLAVGITVFVVVVGVIIFVVYRRRKAEQVVNENPSGNEIIAETEVNYEPAFDISTTKINHRKKL